jgi:hypothetical protein
MVSLVDRGGRVLVRLRRNLHARFPPAAGVGRTALLYQIRNIDRSRHLSCGMDKGMTALPPPLSQRHRFRA